jgi:hypothetical protein
LRRAEGVSPSPRPGRARDIPGEAFTASLFAPSSSTQGMGARRPRP